MLFVNFFLHQNSYSQLVIKISYVKERAARVNQFGKFYRRGTIQNRPPCQR